MRIEIATVSSLLLLCLASAHDSKIVGGVETTIEDVPYQLQLEGKLLGLFWSFSCGAVIIGEDLVLTAAHCAYGSNNNNIRLRSGSSDRGTGTVHTPTDIHVHPEYSNSDSVSDYDIAVIKVQPRFALGSTAQIIQLTSQEPSLGDDATVSGWGVTSETGSNPAAVVRKVIVPIIDRNECKADYSDVFPISDGMICAGLKEGGKDSCSGDSGGPLVVNGTLAGLVSWGEGCAEKGYPGVYTNVYKFIPWVQEQIANLK